MAISEEKKVKFPEETSDVAFNDVNYVMAVKQDGKFGRISKNALKNGLEIEGIEIKPVAPGALPAGPSGQVRKMIVTAVGTWTYGGVEVGSNAEGYQTTFWWDGTAWSNNGSVRVKGETGANGKTIETFNPTKTGGYQAGDSIYYPPTGKQKIYPVLANTAMGESPDTHPDKFGEPIFNGGGELDKAFDGSHVITYDKYLFDNANDSSYLALNGNITSGLALRIHRLANQFIPVKKGQFIDAKGRGDTNTAFLVVYSSAMANSANVLELIPYASGTDHTYVNNYEIQNDGYLYAYCRFDYAGSFASAPEDYVIIKIKDFNFDKILTTNDLEDIASDTIEAIPVDVDGGFVTFETYKNADNPIQYGKEIFDNEINTNYINSTGEIISGNAARVHKISYAIPVNQGDVISIEGRGDTTTCLFGIYKTATISAGSNLIDKQLCLSNTDKTVIKNYEVPTDGYLFAYSRFDVAGGYALARDDYFKMTIKPAKTNFEMLLSNKHLKEINLSNSSASEENRRLSLMSDKPIEYLDTEQIIDMSLTVGGKIRSSDGEITKEGNSYTFVSKYLPIKDGETIYAYTSDTPNRASIALYDSSLVHIKNIGALSDTSTTKTWKKLTNDTGFDAYFRVASILGNNTLSVEEFYCALRNVKVIKSKNSELNTALIPVNNIRDTIFLNDYIKGKKNSSLAEDGYFFAKTMHHRGFRGFGATENSPDALYHTYLTGVKFIECDVRFTLDNIPIIMHDASINRTMVLSSGGAIGTTIDVASTTLAELKANYVYNNTKGVKRTIYTLEEFLKDCKKYGLIPFIEVKSTLSLEHAKIINNLIIKYLDQRAVMVGGFNLNDCLIMRSINQIIEIYHVGNSLSDAQLERLSAYRINNCGNSYSESIKSRTESAGVKNMIYDVNSLDKFNNYTKIGLDYVSTDNFVQYGSNVGRCAVKFSTLMDFSQFIVESGATIVNSVVQMPLNSILKTPNIVNSGLGVLYIEVEGKGEFTLTAPNINYSFTLAELDVVRAPVAITSTADFVVQIKATADNSLVNNVNVEYRVI